MKPSKKHQRIVNDYEKQKQKHLERLGTKLLKEDDKNQKLRAKNIDPGFLNLF
jgi:hypothetical protein